MQEEAKVFCPECDAVAAPEALDRRGFIRVVGESTSLLAAGAMVAAAPKALADAPAARPAAPARAAKPAEALIRELYNGMTAEQKRTVVLPWNNPARSGMFNAAIQGKTIGDNYTRPQQELIERILRSVASNEDGFRQLTRGGTFDGSHSLQGCGSHIFGDPSNGQFAWVFSGHHLTARCDGNSEPDAAFGGPMYYGHSPDGYSQRNIFYYQTRSVLSIFDALTEAQRRQAVVTGSPGEGPNSIRFRAAGQRHPGIAASDLTADQRRLVETVMRDVLSPYRREDADEVMEIVRRNGGLERIHLAFYQDQRMNDSNRWHFWRLEGPGFVWNYRVLPHVHTFVNIAAVRPAAATRPQS